MRTQVPLSLGKVIVLFRYLQPTLTLPVTKQCHPDLRDSSEVRDAWAEQGGGGLRLRPSFGLLKSPGILSHARL